MYPPYGSLTKPNDWFGSFYLKNKDYFCYDAREHDKQMEIAKLHNVVDKWKEHLEDVAKAGQEYTVSRRLFDLVYLCKKDGTLPSGMGEGGPWEGLHRLSGLIPVLFGSAIDDVSSALRPGSLTMESLISPGNDDSSLPNSCDVLAKLEAIHRDHSSPMMEDLIPVSFIYPRVSVVGEEVEADEEQVQSDLEKVVDKSKQHSKSKTESAKPSVCASIGSFLEQFYALVSPSADDYPDFREPNEYILPWDRNQDSVSDVVKAVDTRPDMSEDALFSWGTVVQMKEYKAYCKDPHKKDALLNLLEATKRPRWKYRKDGDTEADCKYVTGPYRVSYDALARHCMSITNEKGEKDIMNVVGFNDLILIPAIMHIIAAAKQNRHVGSKELVEDDRLMHRVQYLTAYHAGSIPLKGKLHGSASVLHGITGTCLPDDGNEDLAATLAIAIMVNSCLAYDEGKPCGSTMVRMIRSLDTKMARLSADEFVGCFGKYLRVVVSMCTYV